MRNKVILGVFALIFFSSLFFWYFNVKKYQEVEINGEKFKVELAQTSKEKNLGLGQRESMQNNKGMLFIFPESAEYAFWMKDMKFDLDIIWINDGRIVYIKKNASQYSSESINPEVRADRVLEIKAGISDQYNFKIGDEVKIN